MSAAKEFREFILRGNVVDLAVGVVIGGAFAKIVNAFVADLITPLIGVFAGKVNLSALHAHVGPVDFAVGDLLNTVITFLIIAAVVFFLVVKPVNYLMSRRKTDTPAEAVTRECPRCLSSVPRAATRCAFCTSDLGPA